MSSIILSSLRIIFWYSPSWPFTTWEVPKVLYVFRPAIHFLLVPIHAIIGPKILATLLAVKHITTVMMAHVLVKCSKYLQRFESHVTDTTWRGETILSFVLCSCVPPVPCGSETSGCSMCRQRCPSPSHIRCCCPEPP